LQHSISSIQIPEEECTSNNDTDFRYNYPYAAIISSYSSHYTHTYSKTVYTVKTYDNTMGDCSGSFLFAIQYGADSCVKSAKYGPYKTNGLCQANNSSVIELSCSSNKCKTGCTSKVIDTIDGECKLAANKDMLKENQDRSVIYACE
jgi:hypothetical protein